MNFFIYGLIFIGVGIVQMWRDVKRKGPHVHRCAQCGTEWAHAIPDEHRNWPSIAAAAAAHTCPKCGAERFEIERFEKVPLKAGGAVQGAAVSSLAAPTASHATGGGLRPERPAPSPKDRDMADHGAGPAPSSTEKKPS